MEGGKGFALDTTSFITHRTSGLSCHLAKARACEPECRLAKTDTCFLLVQGGGQRAVRVCDGEGEAAGFSWPSAVVVDKEGHDRSEAPCSPPPPSSIAAPRCCPRRSPVYSRPYPAPGPMGTSSVRPHLTSPPLRCRPACAPRRRS